MDLDFVSVHKNAKRELGQYPAILTLRLVNNIYLLCSWVRNPISGWKGTWSNNGSKSSPQSDLKIQYTPYSKMAANKLFFCLHDN